MCWLSGSNPAGAWPFLELTMRSTAPRLSFDAPPLKPAASCVVWCLRQALMLAGGAHLSLESVRAAAIGLLTGAPIAALYAALWTPEARKAFPALEDMHKAECEPLDALFEGMSAAQVCLSTFMTNWMWL